MKITAGLGSIDEYERFVQAGADEFFCGYVPFSWAEKYGTVMPLNRREVLCYNVQLGAYSELEILSHMVKKYKKPVHLTFNSLYYLPKQYPEIGDIIEQCMKLGFRSYIIAEDVYKRQIPNSLERITALMAMAITPRIRDPVIAGTARSTSEKYATSIMLIPANRKPRK